MSRPRREFLGYRRENGTAGVRDLLLVLPAVVCANRAAWAAAQAIPGSVALEHPLGCAQIGAD
ncbi:MAG: UxaA family hydrolase, partial [Firmicutes bacterium]|nr:UxaA family hydrolase [Bacillota bacterium]